MGLPGSKLQMALSKAGEFAPKVLVAVGGSGRSQHFAKAMATKESRNKLVKNIVQFLREIPFATGVDLDWETPQSVQQWRDVGKFAKKLRSSLTDAGYKEPLITMGYRPGSGAVAAFSSLQGKSSGRA